jgi:EAL domain-containing protein (putative c-di-GMP-specific phosphodiesterase class I)
VLAETGIADEFSARFRDLGVSPADVTLEISEASLLDRRARAGLRDCSARGFRLAIDDFGTGYASFAYLKELEVDVVKIDRSFVQDLHADPRDEAIVGSISYVAGRLGLRTVAEGVETEAAVRALRRLGVDEAQGFWWSPPLTSAALERWLVARGAPAEGPRGFTGSA